MHSSKTRKKAAQEKETASKQGLDADNIRPDGQKRRTQHPDRFGAPAEVVKDRHGKHLMPNGSAIMVRRMKLSGDSGKDIKKLVEETGRGGPGSGETWHHMADYDEETGEGTVILMPTREHRQSHVGGSAQKRATAHGGDPDSKAKYGY